MQNNNNSNNNTLTLSHSKYWIVLLALETIAIFICYADRSNISTAIIPMSEQYGWNTALQGLILSSFFYGYVSTQLLGGWLSDKFGGKNVLTAGVAVWSLSTVATPIAAQAGAGVLVVFRIILGLGEGVAFPAIHSMISRSVPERWQSTAVAIFTSSSYLGVAVAFYLSPLIIDELGWEWVFYLFGISALAWIPLWLPQHVQVNQSFLTNKKNDDSSIENSSEGIELTSSEMSETNPLVNNNLSSASDSRITPQSSTTSQQYQQYQQQQQQQQYLPPKKYYINWNLFQRKEVWAIGIAQYTQSWGLYGLLSWLPTFFKDEYNLDIQDLGVYTFLPYVAQAGVGATAGVLADRLLEKGYNVRYVRIIIQTISMLGPAACLLLCVSPITTSNTFLATWLVTIGTGLSALSVASVSVSQLDIAPKNSGLIFAFGNTCATAAGLFSVQLTGILLDSFHSWPLVFGVTSLHYVVGAFFWALWVGGERLIEDVQD